MLMKPMQKITRYPLLLKRLQPTLSPGTEEYENLEELISEIEKAIKGVNDKVKNVELRFRIQTIEENLEFGTICEVCDQYSCLEIQAFD